MYLGLFQEEEAVLIEFAARRLCERCGGTAPSVPNRVGSRDERSTEKAASETTVVERIGDVLGVAPPAQRSHDRSVSDASPTRGVQGAQQEDR